MKVKLVKAWKYYDEDGQYLWYKIYEIDGRKRYYFWAEHEFGFVENAMRYIPHKKEDGEWDMIEVKEIDKIDREILKNGGIRKDKANELGIELIT